MGARVEEVDTDSQIPLKPNQISLGRDARVGRMRRPGAVLLISVGLGAKFEHDSGSVRAVDGSQGSGQDGGGSPDDKLLPVKPNLTGHPTRRKWVGRGKDLGLVGIQVEHHNDRMRFSDHLLAELGFEPGK